MSKMSWKKLAQAKKIKPSMELNKIEKHTKKKKNYQLFSNSNPNLQIVKRKAIQALITGSKGTTTTM